MVLAHVHGEDAPQLDLIFAQAPSGETYLKRQYAAFPFHVTQPFHKNGVAEVILQSLGAGLVAGDHFASSFKSESGSARVVTQGSTVAHGMNGGMASQLVRLEVLPGASLFYAPRPLILFAGASVISKLEIILHDGGSVVWVDAFLAHNASASGQTFALLQSETTVVSTSGKILALDRFSITGDAIADSAVMAGHAVHAGIGWAGCHQGPDASQLPTCADVVAGVSDLPDDLGRYVRLLSRDGVAYNRAVTSLGLS
ncbi:MAG: hypothetical protein CMM46_08050 [Rhodospirillaceae bacterium]|nr:hypothetical protein [Rhodospirillaceae bacterium]|tara:strand:- start:22058 stop:22825 length:768 start_codon:yes stop_codon:yes gene_type:complete